MFTILKTKNKMFYSFNSICKSFLFLFAMSVFSHIALADEHIKGNGKITTEQRTAGAFDKISLAGSIDLEINPDGGPSISVETDENVQSSIITEIENNTLKIHVKKDVSVNATKMIVHVSCKDLKEISSGGSGDVKTTAALKTDKFSISHGGSGDFDLTLNVQKLKIDKAGSGDFLLKGTAGTMDISSAGSGDVNATGLQCNTVEISSAGSGNVLLQKGTKAEVSSIGSGKVKYE